VTTASVKCRIIGSITTNYWGAKFWTEALPAPRSIITNFELLMDKGCNFFAFWSHTFELIVLYYTRIYCMYYILSHCTI